MVHEPDFPVPVGVEAQLPTQDAARAVDQHGWALVLSLGPAGERLPSVDFAAVRPRSNGERKAITRFLAERGTRA